jgi:hypothetical protein
MEKEVKCTKGGKGKKRREGKVERDTKRREAKKETKRPTKRQEAKEIRRGKDRHERNKRRLGKCLGRERSTRSGRGRDPVCRDAP